MTPKLSDAVLKAMRDGLDPRKKFIDDIDWSTTNGRALLAEVQAARGDEARFLCRGPWVGGRGTRPHRLVLYVFQGDAYVVHWQGQAEDGRRYFADGDYFPWRSHGGKEAALQEAAARFAARLAQQLRTQIPNLLETPP